MIREKSAGVQILVLMACFMGGVFPGLALAEWVAPGSGLASAASGMMLTAGLFFGMLAWLGLAVLSLPVLIIRRLLGRLPPLEKDEAFIPSGSFAFLPATAIPSTLAGLVSGLVPGGWGVMGSGLLYLGAGCAWGFVLWKLAANGFLPFPQE